MWEFLAAITKEQVGVAIAAFGAIMLIFVVALGRERTWKVVQWVGNKLSWRSPPPAAALAMLVGASMLAGCAAFPRTTAAFNEGGLGPAIDEFLTQTSVRVVAICQVADGPRLSSIVDLAAIASGHAERVAEIRAERQLWCDAFDGKLVLDVQ